MLTISHRLRFIAKGLTILAAFTLGLLWYMNGELFLPAWSTWFWTLCAPFSDLMFAGFMLVGSGSYSGLTFFAILLAPIVAIAMHPVFQRRWSMLVAIVGFVIWGVVETLLALA